MSMDWRAFWDGQHSIYVSERHRRVHYARVAEDIISVLPGAQADVLDYGCGEALFAERVAERCSRLILCDSAPSVRERLAQRYAGNPGIGVVAPDEVPALEDKSLDLVVSNSVLQYLTVAEFDAVAHLWRRKLKPSGKLVLADLFLTVARARIDQRLRPAQAADMVGAERRVVRCCHGANLPFLLAFIL